jgi:SH3-like domain-containing protein
MRALKQRCTRPLLALCAIFGIGSANALAGEEFRSIAVEAALLYDAPAASATRVAILTRHYPVYVVKETNGWAQVRDAAGQALWIEAKALSTRRTVLVAVQMADARLAADINSPIVFRAEKEVALELLDASGAWVKVRHRDGSSGFMRADQLWGL